MRSDHSSYDLKETEGVVHEEIPNKLFVSDAPSVSVEDETNRDTPESSEQRGAARSWALLLLCFELASVPTSNE